MKDDNDDDDDDDDDDFKDCETWNFSWIWSLEFRETCLYGKEAFRGPLLSLKYYIALLSNNFNYTPLAKRPLIILIIYLEHYL